MRLGAFLSAAVITAAVFGFTWQSMARTRAPKPESTDPNPVAIDASGPWESFQKPADAELRAALSSTQYEVTQEDGTERPFQNEFWDNHADGIYVDVVSGEPLFSSLDKFESGTGWPSFTRPLIPDLVVERTDTRLGMRRVEVRSKMADSHLGHVFPDGPEPTGLRYCINSASLRFVPVDDLAGAGYGDFLPLFGKGGDAPRGADEKVGMMAENTEVATLAGGCFWGMEQIIREIPGVLDTQVGYTGGHVENATYEDVKRGSSGHAESVRIVFDPNVLSYEELLGWFFRMHDPTTMNRQGNDRGSQYRSAIFYHSDAQRDAAERVKAQVDGSGKWRDPIVTEIVAASKWYDAEAFHQDYLVKNPNGYTCHYLRD